MLARDIMTRPVECCTATTNLRDAAQRMADGDYGSLPVVESHERRRLVGVITDRDIACRAVALGLDPAGTAVAQCMSVGVISVTPNTSLDECCRRLEDNQLRRLPVIDGDGNCCGIIAQADIAMHAGSRYLVNLMREVSDRPRAVT